MLTKETRVMVVMGGWSAEREVSLATGGAVLECLRQGGYNVRGHDLAPSGARMEASGDFISSLREWPAQVVYIALHGPFGEDGTMQGLLEMLGIPYTGSGILASALAIDKDLAKQVFVASRLTTPKYVMVSRGKAPSSPPLPLPAVVKPRSQGSSVGVSLVEKTEEFGPALEKAFEFERDALVETYVAGREIQGGVLDGAALPLIEVVSKNKLYDYEAKYIPGKSEHKVPASLPKKQYEAAQRMAVAAYRALNCRGAARVEMMAEHTGTLYLLEVNTLPGMTPTSLLPEAAREAGMSFLDLVVRQIEIALREPADGGGGEA